MDFKKKPNILEVTAPTKASIPSNESVELFSGADIKKHVSNFFHCFLS